jgi:hypothetical protein
MVKIDNVLRAVVLAGVTNLLIENVVISICVAWAYYFYESSKND